MSLEWVHVSRGVAVCETDELRDLADDPALVGDGEIGVLLDSGDCDGALLYGNDADELIAELECAIGNLRAVKAQREQGMRNPKADLLVIVVEPTKEQREYTAALVSRLDEVRIGEWDTEPGSGELPSENDCC